MLPSIGIVEILVIFVITILVVKPEDFPRFIRRIGKLYGKFHDTMFKFKNYTRETYEQISNIEGMESELDDDYDYDHDHDYHDDHYNSDGFDTRPPDHLNEMDDEIEDQLESGYDPFADDADYTLGYDDDFSDDDSVYLDLSEIKRLEEEEQKQKELAQKELEQKEEELKENEDADAESTLQAENQDNEAEDKEQLDKASIES